MNVVNGEDDTDDRNTTDRAATTTAPASAADIEQRFRVLVDQFERHSRQARGLLRKMCNENHVLKSERDDAVRALAESKGVAHAFSSRNGGVADAHSFDEDEEEVGLNASLPAQVKLCVDQATLAKLLRTYAHVFKTTENGEICVMIRPCYQSVPLPSKEDASSLPRANESGDSGDPVASSVDDRAFQYAHVGVHSGPVDARLAFEMDLRKCVSGCPSTGQQAIVLGGRHKSAVVKIMSDEEDGKVIAKVVRSHRAEDPDAVPGSPASLFHWKANQLVLLKSKNVAELAQ